MFMQVIHHLESAKVPRSAPGSRSRNRAVILDVAGRLLRKRSLDGLTMDEIAREAGLTRRTIYNYFAGTGDIFEISRKTLLNELAPIVPSAVSSDLSLQAALLRFAFQALRVFEDDRHMDLYLSVAREGGSNPWIIAAYDNAIQGPMINALTAYLTEARRAGRFGGDPRSAAFQLLWTLQAAAASARLFGRSHSGEAVPPGIDAIVNAFLIQNRAPSALAA